jgi:hypothetical protein
MYALHDGGGGAALQHQLVVHRQDAAFTSFALSGPESEYRPVGFSILP